MVVKTNGDLVKVPSLMSELFDTETFFSKMFPELRGTSIPSVNIKEDETKFQMELAIPGLSRNDIKINVENNMIEISGEKKEEKEEKEKNFRRREFNYSSFSRSFSLPESANADGIKAEYKEGILYLSVPKKEEVIKKAKKVIPIS